MVFFLTKFLVDRALPAEKNGLERWGQDVRSQSTVSELALSHWETRLKVAIF